MTKGPTDSRVQQNPLTREIEGRAVPQVGRYDIGPVHSTIEASVRHLMVAKVRGGFTRFSGVIEVAEDVAASAVSLDIETASIDTRDEKRDGHMRSPDFLDVESHPVMTFRSTAVRPNGSADRWTVVGDLSLRGVTREVTLDTEFLEAMIDHRDRHRIAFSATTKLDREEFGMTWNQALEAGGVVVGKTLDIALEVQALQV